MSVPYLNRQLFSDHWLRERLPQREDYALTPLGLAKLALWLRGLPVRCRGADGWSADETQQRIVAPCLALLGYDAGEWRSTHLTLWSQGAELLWRFAPLAPISDPAADAARGAPGHALLGVAPWGADLDARSPTASLAPRADGSARTQAPALHFLRLLATAHDDVEWGILTNGRCWRLYARGGATLEASYEVEL
ncbi:MAG: hypothetical protein ACRDID_13465, partial [Ktedonobacterales bacterium]